MSEFMRMYPEVSPAVKPSLFARIVAFMPTVGYAGLIGLSAAGVFNTGVREGQEQPRPTRSVSAPVDHYGLAPITIEGPDGKIHHCKGLTALDCFDVVYGYYPSRQASSGEAVVEPNTHEKVTSNSVNITVSNDNNEVAVSGNMPPSMIPGLSGDVPNRQGHNGG